MSSKRSTRIHSNKIEVNLVIVDTEKNAVIRLPKDWSKRVCDPSNKIFFMVCGYLTKRNDVRKRKFRRIIMDPLTKSCYRIQYKRRTHSHGTLYIGSMKIGKQIKIRQYIVDVALGKGTHELGKICD